MTRVEKEIIQFLDDNGPCVMSTLEAKLMKVPRFHNMDKRRTRVRAAIQSLLMKTVLVINKDNKLEFRT